jgi:hypothetical protein
MNKTILILCSIALPGIWKIRRQRGAGRPLRSKPDMPGRCSAESSVARDLDDGWLAAASAGGRLIESLLYARSCQETPPVGQELPHRLRSAARDLGQLDRLASGRRYAQKATTRIRKL